MSALINVTNNVSSDLPSNSDVKRELISLFKQKIEDSIAEERSVIVTISNSIMECRNTIHIEDMEFAENHLCLIDGNFELHINLDEIEMKHDDSMDVNDMFVFKHGDMEIDMYFLG